MIGRIIFGIIGISLGVTIMLRAQYIVNNITGSLAFAEKYLGSGGTYAFYRILGFIMTVVSMLVMFGFAGTIYSSIINGLNGII